ncbi:MAG: peptidase in kexin sedolisin [Chthonomonadales bacterium]|nr:peptidase in kexin sedolisin [Chthonomonadales bacterium]
MPAKIKVKVVDKRTGAAIPNATVVAFTNFAARAGAQGVTNSQGMVSLSLGSSSPQFDRFYVYPKLGYWPVLLQNVTFSTGMKVKLPPIDLSFQDSLRFFYGESQLGQGAGVTVGVVDTGIAPHDDLVIAGGFNAVSGEDPTEFGDNGEGHGTHVGGIIAARGTLPTGIRGLAPGVTLRSYRVFGAGQPGASNFTIAKAIDQAVQDGCDLLNLSLGGGPPDPVLQTAIHDARQGGCVVLCAAGNDDRSPVSFPGSDPLSVAVSALGRKGTVPAEAEEVGNIQFPPNGTDPKNYIASFSNVGPELSLTAPGDGIISTFPGGYAVLDGTSMACPAATGMAAQLLSSNAALLEMPRDVNRSEALVTKLLQTATSLGFGPEFEGHGMLPKS